MTARVAFQPADPRVPLPLDELGRDERGAWGVIDDGTWLASPAIDTLELLYLSPGEYQRAMRGLAAPEIAAAVALRRQTYASAIASIAVGVVEMRVRDCLAALGATAPDFETRRDLLSVTASFTLLSAFADSRPLRLFDALRAGDGEIIAELESASLRAWTAADHTDEVATRRRFAAEIGDLGTRRGRPAEEAPLLPYHDVERTYLLRPASAELEAAAHAFHEPTMHFRDGLVMPAPERELAALRAAGHQTAIVFPTRQQFLGASAGMTPAQLNVELTERLQDPGFGPFLRALRLQQATLRVAVGLLLGADGDIAPVVEGHVDTEVSSLAAWLSDAPLDPTQADGHDVRTVARDAAFLTSFCRRHGRLQEAGGLEPFARALRQIAERG